jgi:hypothetical protein
MNEVNCSEMPVVRYTWPWQDEKYACIDHAIRLADIANALGFHLQFIP